MLKIHTADPLQFDKKTAQKGSLFEIFYKTMENVTYEWQCYSIVSRSLTKEALINALTSLAL